MRRIFNHEFHPLADGPVDGPEVELTVQQIEDASLREVLQAPGAPYGSWAMLDSLLEPTGDGTPFVFREPLGEAREVKVALSGLLGRFVARAYLERYFGLTIFAHVRSGFMLLDNRLAIEVVRLERGDLPDWIACDSSLSNLTVAEAKGSHDPAGPARALGRAWNQAQRISIHIGGHPVTLKRVAVASRWGAASGSAHDPWISVRDPIEEGDPVGPEHKDAIVVSLVRQHLAGILAPLGHVELANTLRKLSSAASGSKEWRDQERRRLDDLLDEAEDMSMDEVHGLESLIGGLVTRAGPVPRAGESGADREMLARLDLRPVFVGVERMVVHAAVDGNANAIRKALRKRRTAGGAARSDGAGGWIIPAPYELGSRS